MKPLKNRDQPHDVLARLNAEDIGDLVDLDGRTNADREQHKHSDQADKKPKMLRTLFKDLASKAGDPIVISHD